MDQTNIHITDELLKKVDQMEDSDRKAFLRTLPDNIGQQINKLLSADQIVRQKDLLKSIARQPEKSDTFEKIDSYKVLKVLGEGGMGTVYMAQQTHPVKRLVALKVIKAGMDSSQVIARFEAERQALAMMEHPNIAKVLDAGTTDSGRPYFAMELVRGVPLTKYCDQKRLSTNERLEIFNSVCFAIQHAHQKGIIHRDIKPSNVLVAEDNGNPVAKVIDFGLAKALHTSLTDRTIVTQFNQTIGTVQYMSPEQTEVNALDIDTRSDIYSLGVMLYELLTGSTPIDKKTMSDMALDRILKVIREREPPTPSSRLSSSNAEAISGICNLRDTDPRLLRSILRGDLDWIVMKALEKDRNRRYETANSFAQDVQRFLDNDVVLARPPSTAYRLQKFVSKNLKAVITASVLFAVLAASTVVSTHHYIKAETARAAADNSREVEKLQREKAEAATKEADAARIAAEKSERTVRAQATSVEEINAFLTEMFAATRPAALLGSKERPTDDRSRIDRIHEDYADEPAVQAELMYLIGEVYIGMGQIRESAVYVRESHQLQEQLFKDSTEKTQRELELKLARGLDQLATIHMYEWRNESGKEIAGRARAIHEKYFGPTHQLTMASRVIQAFGEFQSKWMSDNGKRRTDGILNSLREWEEICRIHKSNGTDSRGIINNELIIAAHYGMLAKEEKDSWLRLKYGTLASTSAASALSAAGPRLKSDKSLRLLSEYAKSLFNEYQGKEATTKEQVEDFVSLSRELFFGNPDNPLGLYVMHLGSLRDKEMSLEKLQQLEAAYLRTYGEVPRTAAVVTEVAHRMFLRRKVLSEKQIQSLIEIFQREINVASTSLGEQHWKVGVHHKLLGGGLFVYYAAQNITPSPEISDLIEYHLRKSLEIFGNTNTVGYSFLDNRSCQYLIDNAILQNRATPKHLRPVLDHLKVWYQQDPDDPRLTKLVEKLPTAELKAFVWDSGV